jgi:hypothetical protein
LPLFLFCLSSDGRKEKTISSSIFYLRAEEPPLSACLLCLILCNCSVSVDVISMEWRKPYALYDRIGEENRRVAPYVGVRNQRTAAGRRVVRVGVKKAAGENEKRWRGSLKRTIGIGA